MIDAKIGDNIYLKRGGSGQRIMRVETVTRITPTLIRSENYSYRRTDLGIRGQDAWFRTWAYLETPKLKEQWREQCLRNWAENHVHQIPLKYIEQAKAELALEKDSE
jgi:hypothetical protein